MLFVQIGWKYRSPFVALSGMKGDYLFIFRGGLSRQVPSAGTRGGGDRELVKITFSVLVK
jgi:hypothetical protein